MACTEARGMIHGALKDLHLRWHETLGEWRDENAKRFEAQFVHPLGMDVKAAVVAIEQLGKVLAQVRRDCS
jgi:hypothetical protein